MEKNTTITTTPAPTIAPTRSERKAAARFAAEQQMRLKPSARDLHRFLLPQLRRSRPVVGTTPETFHADGTRTGGAPIYGRPTFRNVIVNGEHV